MKLSFPLRRCLPWINLPVGLLIALLQRTPVLRVLTAASEHVAISPVGQLLRAAFTVATLGALHSRAGATTFVQAPANPVRGTVGTPLSVAFTYNGTPSAPARFQVSGSLPAGLAFIPAPVGGFVLSGAPVISGTPSQAGTFTVSVQGFNAEGLTNNIAQQILFDIAPRETNAAPTISTHPQSQTATVGGTATFVVQASGTPAPAYQWTRDGNNITGATTATLTLPNVQLSDAGAYRVVVSNAAGSITSNAATLTVNPAGGGGGPVSITSHPVSQTVSNGSTVVFSVTAGGATSYQWRRNGADLPGATTSMLVINSVTPAQAGDYTVVAISGANRAASSPATLTVSASADFSRLINLSIFTAISNADPKFSLGTVIGGPGTRGTKALLVRAAGPSLAQLGVSGPMPDPKLDVFANGALARSNDNWGGGAALGTAFIQVGAFAYVAQDSKDAAVFDASAAGAYAVEVSGVAGATGPVIAEIYDASPSTALAADMPRLINVSVLKQIATGTTLSAGFVIGGGVTARTVLIRAIGPTLGAAPFNLGGVMADPKLELYQAGTLVAVNDNWGGDAQLTAIGNSVGAFAVSNAASRDAILLLTLAPGPYAAVVSGIGAGGSALVEVYEVP